MNLDEYLTGLKMCPDEHISHNGREIAKLTAEFGIYDNWPIFLKGNFDLVFNDLRANLREHFPNGFEFVEDRSQGSYRNSHWNYVPGTIDMQLHSFPGECDFTFSDEHETRQRAEYRIAFCLWPYRKDKKMNVPRERAIALATIEIAEYAKKRNLGVCIPHSIGWQHRNDFSRVVYYP